MKTVRLQRLIGQCLASGPKTVKEMKDYINEHNKWGTTSQSLTTTLNKNRSKFEAIPYTRMLSKWRIKE